ncbi:MAG: type II toxin-antitoxin system death-on-curing family toxin [Planctomycetaceae bacterium]
MPEFLTLEDVLELHAGQIKNYGGSEGLRSSDLLQSAIAQPWVTFGGQFLHTDIYQMAAAYLFHLVQNHPFIDGNKRIGLEAALVFLELNGQSIEADDEQLVEIVLGVSRGHIDKTQIAEFFRNHAVTP